MNEYEEALALADETVANRRRIHEQAEVGLDLPRTVAFVEERLREYGLEPVRCGHGVTATVGHGGRVLLLRADMDALPMQEASGEPFSCPDGAAHACGHDMHAAMLLTAARMLKEREGELAGTVKLMFQPAEEIFKGSLDMIEAGVLEDPHVDAALAYHVGPGRMPTGLCMYNDTGTMMLSVDGFRIEILGRPSHGAYPELGVDPINIGVHVHLALQELVARECSCYRSCVLTVGQFHAGSAANSIPDRAVLEGTLRTDDEELRQRVLARVREVATRQAEAFGGSAEVTSLSACPPLVCDPELTREVAGYMEGLHIPGMAPVPDVRASASEDFSFIAQRVPSTFMYLSAGYEDERGERPAHDPRVRFNEDVLPIGSACLVRSAVEWLRNHQ